MQPLHTISHALARDVDALELTTPAFTYNPLAYAWAPHDIWLSRYGRPGVRALLVGMNPGPFGMAQTGVPFGDIPSVRDWLGIEAPVGRPPAEHPKRPIEGFGLSRREGSGKRLWGWAEERFGSPDAFFDQMFVHNYCPLLFLHDTGRNVTPDKLSREERDAIFAPCDRALREVVDTLQPTVVLGIGKFAFGRAADALGLEAVAGTQLDCILHPSPANPLANRDWAGQVEPVMRRHGIDV